MKNLPIPVLAVFDCNTIVQAIAFRNGPAAACMRLVDSGQITLFVSKRILREFRAVLFDPEVRALNTQITDEDLHRFLDFISFRASLTRKVPHALDYKRDPDDEPYIDLAIAIEAHFMVTSDKDLLDLMTGHSLACKQFRQQARGLRVVTPAQLLALLRPKRNGAA